MAREVVGTEKHSLGKDGRRRGAARSSLRGLRLLSTPFPLSRFVSLLFEGCVVVEEGLWG